MSGRQNAVKQPCKDKTNGKHHKTYQPIRYQFGSNKREFTDRCHIDLFNRTRLFLAHYIKGGKKAANQRQQHHHKCRNHKELIVQRRIIEIQCGNTDMGKWFACQWSYSHFRLQFTGIVTDDGRKIRTAQTSFCSVHRIGGNKQTGSFAVYPVFLEITGNLQNNICRTSLNTVQSLIIRIGKRCQTEISGSIELIHQTTGHNATVIIDDIEINILYLQIGSPRHQYHNHTREYENQLRQE